MTSARHGRDRLLVFCLGVIAIVACTKVNAQEQYRTHEGQNFLVGFIHPERAPGEPPAKNGYRIIVSSRFATTAVVAGKNVTISPNTSVEVVIDSCDVATVTSDKPITVASRIFMQGNGEQAIQIPTHAWGTRYLPFSWWTDRYGLGTLHYAAAQRLVIARDDNTVINVYNSSGGRQLKLNAGEYAYLPVTLDTNLYRNADSDPTGEIIVADKPVGVISGHGKTAVLEHPDALPASGPYARAANRSRGTLMESMIPADHAGTTFVTVPFLYSPTRKRGLDQSSVGIADDRGDVVRFIGTTSSTILSYASDTGIVIVDTLGEGEVYTNRMVDGIRVWQASRPVLCAQYGKSYAHITSQATLPEDDPSTDAGLPMLVSIPSTNQWTTNAILSCPQDLVNYVNVVCRVEHTSTMLLDGKQLQTLTTPMTTVNGEFALMRMMISPGSHVISSTNNDATFMTVSYGNLDGLQLCNAYASTAGFVLLSTCPDSIRVTIRQDSDSASATHDVVALSSCEDVGIAMLFAAETYNCEATVMGNMAHIVRTRSTDSAFAVVECITRHGSVSQRRIYFDATTSVTQDNIQKSGIAVYPTPANNTLHVSLHQATTASESLRFTDVFGRSDEFFILGSHAILDLAGYSPGLYVLSTSSASIPVIIVR